MSSYYLPAERVLIDPIAPEDGLDWFAEHGPPTDVLLTNRHHYRSSAQFAERFGVTVHCVREGMHEFGSGEQVEPFDFGDELPGGVIAYEVGAICPDETALHIPGPRRARARRRSSALGAGRPALVRPRRLHGRARADEGGAARLLSAPAKLDFRASPARSRGAARRTPDARRSLRSPAHELV